MRISASREVMGLFPTGVVLVTAHDGDRPLGMTIGSFMSVSLEPQLVAFCVSDGSTTWPLMRDLGRFCVNIVGSDDRDLCAQFARSGADRFQDTAWWRDDEGSPVLDRAIAWLDCETHTTLTLGDHDLVVGRVRSLGIGQDGGPLLFFKKRFGEYVDSRQ